MPEFFVVYVFSIFGISSKGKKVFTTTWLAQLEERRSAEREVAGPNPGRTNAQGS